MDFNQVRDTLKDMLKARGVTYKKFGHAIGMSESAVKKLFASKDCSLNRLLKICEFLDLSINDLLVAAEDVSVKRTNFSGEAQSFFLENMDCFYFFCKLVYERQTIEEIQQESSISAKRVSGFLKNLTRLGLVQIGSSGQVIPPNKEVVLWNERGPLIDQLKQSWSEKLIQETLDHLGPETGRCLVLQTLQLKQDSYQEFRQSLSDLVLQFQKRSVREFSFYRAEASSHRLLIAMMPGSFIGKIDTK